MSEPAKRKRRRRKGAAHLLDEPRWIVGSQVAYACSRGDGMGLVLIAGDLFGVGYFSIIALEVSREAVELGNAFVPGGHSHAELPACPTLPAAMAAMVAYAEHWQARAAAAAACDCEPIQ